MPMRQRDSGEPPEFAKWLIWLFQKDTWLEQPVIALIAALIALSVACTAIYNFSKLFPSQEWCMRVTPRMDGKHTHCFPTKEECDSYEQFAQKSLATTPLRQIEPCVRQ